MIYYAVEIKTGRIVNYYGFRSKKKAQAFCDEWNVDHNNKVEVFKI